MNEEKEIAGIALPFALGIGISAGLSPMSIHHSVLYGSVVTMVFPALAILFLYRNRLRPLRDAEIFAGIALTAFFAGMLCMNASSLSLDFSSGISEFAHHCGSAAGAFIDSLPFEHSDTNALLKALLTGDRSGLSRDCTETFRESGASHILALSGLHIGIIYGIVAKITSLLGRGSSARCLRSMLNISVCLFYVLCTGAGHSIVRAFIFILLSEIALLSHRKHKLKQILFSTIFIQLALEPRAITSISFQLSYAALAGIAFIHPTLTKLWTDYIADTADNSGPPETDSGRGAGEQSTAGASPSGMHKPGGLLYRIWSLSTLSISCQLTTAPLAWYYFHSFPKYFLITNLLALPLVGMLIPAAIACILLCAVFPDTACACIALNATEWLAQLMQTTLNIISKM